MNLIPAQSGGMIHFRDPKATDLPEGIKLRSGPSSTGMTAMGRFFIEAEIGDVKVASTPIPILCIVLGLGYSEGQRIARKITTDVKVSRRIGIPRHPVSVIVLEETIGAVEGRACTASIYSAVCDSVTSHPFILLESVKSLFQILLTFGLGQRFLARPSHFHLHLFRHSDEFFLFVRIAITDIRFCKAFQ